MYNFFVDPSDKGPDGYVIHGTDYNHIKNVLRMREGDTFLVSCDGLSSLCRLERFDEDRVLASVVEEDYQNTNLPVDIVLFQGLPKSDKMELILQKSVELGAAEVVPVAMKRCVVKLVDPKKSKSKVARWQAIAESAAKQSKRNAIPKVSEVVSYSQALALAKDFDLLLVPYENEDGMAATKQALAEIKSGMRIGILIGPEGGFDPAEIEAAKAVGAKVISLGKRILRTETAAITAVGMCMLHIEMNVSEDER